MHKRSKQTYKYEMNELVLNQKKVPVFITDPHEAWPHDTLKACAKKSGMLYCINNTERRNHG